MKYNLINSLAHVHKLAKVLVTYLTEESRLRQIERAICNIKIIIISEIVLVHICVNSSAWRVSK